MFMNGMERGPASYKLGGEWEGKAGTDRRRKGGRRNVTLLISLYVQPL